jgi:L-xylulose reductase
MYQKLDYFGMFQCPSIRPVCVDLSDLDSATKAVEALGPIDLLVNNAGTYYEQSFVDVDMNSLDT